MNLAASDRKMGWRAPILQQFSPEIAASSPLTLVADPDGLLTEPDLLADLVESGFEVLTLEDPLATRYEYESRFRSTRQSEEGVAVSLVIRCEQIRTR